MLATLACGLLGVDLGQEPNRLATHLRMHREDVDHVGPAVAVGVAVAQQLLGDLVAVVADQGGAEVVPCRGRELQQQIAEAVVRNSSRRRSGERRPASRERRERKDSLDTPAHKTDPGAEVGGYPNPIE